MQDDKLSKRFAIAACAYALYGLQPHMIPWRLFPAATATYFFAVPMVVGLLCAVVTLVAMGAVIRLGPTWSRITGILLSLPPICMLVVMIWGMFGELNIFTLMT